jgi:hypothetical protein
MKKIIVGVLCMTILQGCCLLYMGATAKSLEIVNQLEEKILKQVNNP